MAPFGNALGFAIGMAQGIALLSKDCLRNVHKDGTKDSPWTGVVEACENPRDEPPDRNMGCGGLGLGVTLRMAPGNSYQRSL